MSDWEAYRDLFEWDGSWRDIYILDTQVPDWQRLLDHLRVRNDQLSFTVDDMPAPLPPNVDTIFALREQANPFLGIWIERLQVNCHFFGPGQIEFDIDPREIRDSTDFTLLLNFMADVGATVEKEVRLTPENGPEHVLLRYNPATRQFEAG
jgi:hypothetical protein